ncbi:MAG TPA: hypothetical protein VI039_04075 [Solirubrobacterales bacterium]
MIVALIALFAALGGSAYAAKKIGTKEIKANAITTGKIKKNAVTTAKIKKEAVTGAKIKESTLGTVPFATNADNATNAVNATNFSRFHSTGLVKLSVGQTVQILAVGPITFFTKCTDNAGTYEVESYATTSQPKSNISSYEEEYYESDWEPGEQSTVGYDESSSSTPYWAVYGYGGYYTGFAASSGDGKTILSGEVINSVRSFGADCAVSMYAVNMG